MNYLSYVLMVAFTFFAPSALAKVKTNVFRAALQPSLKEAFILGENPIIVSIESVNKNPSDNLCEIQDGDEIFVYFGFVSNKGYLWWRQPRFHGEVIKLHPETDCGRFPETVDIILPDSVAHEILDGTRTKLVGSWPKPLFDELINKFDELHAKRTAHIQALTELGDSLAGFNDILAELNDTLDRNNDSLAEFNDNVDRNIDNLEE